VRGQTDNNQLKIAQGIVSEVIYGERNSSTPSFSFRKCQYSTGLERCQLLSLVIPTSHRAPRFGGLDGPMNTKFVIYVSVADECGRFSFHFIKST
jgi:hypothetical protein